MPRFNDKEKRKMIQARVKMYVLDRHAKGKIYNKSRHIAQELGFTTREVAGAIVQINNENTDIKLECCAHSKSTTWETIIRNK